MNGGPLDPAQEALIACAAQLLAAMTDAAVAEGLALGRAAGLPEDALSRYLQSASAQSAALERALAPRSGTAAPAERPTDQVRYSTAHAHAYHAGIDLPLLAALAANEERERHAER